MKSVRKTHIERHELRCPDRAAIARILQRLTPHSRRVVLVVGCIIGSATLNLAFPYFVKRIVDVAIPRGDLSLLALYCAGMVVGPLAAGLLQVAVKYQAEVIGQRVMLDLRVAIYRRLPPGSVEC